MNRLTNLCGLPLPRERGSNYPQQPQAFRGPACLNHHDRERLLPLLASPLTGRRGERKPVTLEKAVFRVFQVFQER